MEKRRLKAVLLTLAAAALWGTSFPLVKVGLENANPYDFLMWRFLLATSVLLIIQLLRGAKIRGLFRLETVTMGFVMSLSFLLQYVAQVSTTASEAAVLVNTSPIMVPLFAYVLINEQLSLKRWPAVISGMFGIILTSGIVANGSSAGSPVAGTLELLLSAVLTSIFIVISKKNMAGIKTVDLILGSFIFASAFVFIFTLISGNFSMSLWSNQISVASVVYLSIFCTVVPFFLWFRGLRSLSATTSTVITLFEPVVGIIISVTFLGEVFTVIAAAGTALIFLGIALMSV